MASTVLSYVTDGSDGPSPVDSVTDCLTSSNCSPLAEEEHGVACPSFSSIPSYLCERRASYFDLFIKK